MISKQKNTDGRFLVKSSVAALMVGLLVTVGGLMWAETPVGSGEPKVFVVERGESVTKIAHNLRQAKLIRSERFFRMWVRCKKYNLQAG